MRKGTVAALLSFAGLLAGCMYGPMRDSSSFKSAFLCDEGRLVALSFHNFEYRPARGIAAFPDGGVPRYLADRSIVCLYDKASGAVKVMMRAENRDWCNGSGVLTISQASGHFLLVCQSGQLRRDLFTTRTVHHIIDIYSGTVSTFCMRDDLSAHGRQAGAVYLDGEEGCLAVITYPQGGKGAGPEEIWVRRPDGRYLKAAEGSIFEQISSGLVVYWNPADRSFYGFNAASGSTSRLDGYKVPAFTDQREGVSIGSAGADIEYGVKKEGRWFYEPLNISREKLKKE